jgi:hypothetical protein
MGGVQSYGAAVLALLALAAPAKAAKLDSIHPSAVTLETITAKLAESEARKFTDLQQYSATRKYMLRNARMHKDAQMTVRMVYRKGEGKTFQVVSVDGAEGMSRKIFDRLIEAEKDASRSDSREHGRLTSENYNFQLLGIETENGRRTFVLELQPRKKSKYLLQGKAWIDADDFAMVRLEGRPSASISFWVGKPYVVQSFQKVGDFWLASENRSVADCKFVGKSELTVESTGYEVQPVYRSGLASRQLPRELKAASGSL